MILTDEERETMEKIIGVMYTIQDWGLIANQTELTIHIHGLQSFIIQRALQRNSPDEFGAWYKENDADD